MITIKGKLNGTTFAIETDDMDRLETFANTMDTWEYVA